MENILDKDQIIDSNYEIKFFIEGDDYYQKYRVKGRDGNIYLLKIYDSSKVSRYSFVDGDLLEVKILKKLDNKTIVKLVDHGEVVKNNHKYHFIVFDFVSGETLQDKLKREGAFSTFSAVSICLNILNTLGSLHSQSDAVIHNNISLSSITLDYTDSIEKPILTNFYFSRFISSKSNSINLEQLSPFYMSPELYNGVFTPQSDIFAVGALLYNLIMGIPPWYIEVPAYQHTKDNVVDKIFKKRSSALSFVMKDFEEIHDDQLKDSIKKALALNVDDRFSTVNEFIQALERKMEPSSTDVTISQDRQVLTIKDGDGFSAIAGMQDLKDILYNDVIRALNEKELYESYGITIPNGMLLYGPPGCGKTFISERFSEEVGFNYLELKPSDIKSKYINATEENIGRIFKEAETNAPTIIFIDEIDAVVPNRESDMNEMNAGPVNEFLAQMSNCGERGIFVIAASNRPEKIDPAILRTGRIDRIIYLPPPDKDARTAMLELYLKNRPVDLSVNYDLLAELTENYVSSDIKFIVDEASRFALKAKEKITQGILENVISEGQQSVSIAEINKYQALRDKFENKNKDDSLVTRRSIGFISNN